MLVRNICNQNQVQVVFLNFFESKKFSNISATRRGFVSNIKSNFEFFIASTSEQQQPEQAAENKKKLKKKDSKKKEKEIKRNQSFSSEKPLLSSIQTLKDNAAEIAA